MLTSQRFRRSISPLRTEITVTLFLQLDQRASRNVPARQDEVVVLDKLDAIALAGC